MTAPSREELIEIVARAMCVGSGANPDMPAAGEANVFWRTKLPEAEAAADAILARIGGEREADQKRIAELEAAVRWALGEGDSDFPPLSMWTARRLAPYGWRTHLRAMAFPSPPGGGG